MNPLMRLWKRHKLRMLANRAWHAGCTDAKYGIRYAGCSAFLQFGVAAMAAYEAGIDAGAGKRDLRDSDYAPEDVWALVLATARGLGAQF